MSWLKRLLGAVLLTCCTAVNAIPGDPAPLGAPNLDIRDTGVVFATARLPDGSVIVGGSFTTAYDAFSGLLVDRSNLAKYSANGSLDLAWNPGADGIVYALAADGAGNLYIGGAFNSVGGVARQRLARVATTQAGAIDPIWNPAADNTVYAIELDEPNAVFVGGDFQNVGGRARKSVARLSITGAGAADAAWDAAVTGSTVRALAVDGAGSIFIGGSFSSIGGRTRSCSGKLTASGSAIADANWNPGGCGTVSGLVPDGVGSIYAYGTFSTIGGQSRQYVAKLAASGVGSADATWNPMVGAFVNSVEVGASGVYIGGSFNIVGGQARNGLVRVSASGAGTVDSTWVPNTNGRVRTITLAASGQVDVGGEFTTPDAAGSVAFARYSTASASTVGRFALLKSGEIYDLARATDGSLFAGGKFSFILDPSTAVVRGNLFKLDSSGLVDRTWSPTTDGSVRAIATDGSSVFIGGAFGFVNGQTRPLAAKISASGQGVLDPVWNFGATGGTAVFDLAIGPSGSLFVGGLFSVPGGNGNLIKVSTAGSGSQDPLWNLFVNSSVFALAVDGAGQLYVGGNFTQITSLTRNFIARISPSGVADANWNPDASSQISSLALDGSGNLFVGGLFATIGGASRQRIAKLSTGGTGAADANWNPGASGPVRALLLDGAGGIVAGGEFTTIGGQPRSYLGKLSATGTGAVSGTWDPSANNFVYALSPAGVDAAYVAGSFTRLGNSNRTLIAGVPLRALILFSNGFE